MKNYRVEAQRAGEWWALSVPDIPGVHSQTKRLDQAEQEIREAISLFLDVEEDEFEVTLDPQLPSPIELALEQVREARLAAEACADLLRVSLARAVLVMTDSFSQRDAGRLLDVSFQRVHQIKDSAPPVAELEERRDGLLEVLAALACDLPEISPSHRDQLRRQIHDRINGSDRIPA